MNIKKTFKKNRIPLIAIAGGTASGKTTIVQTLQKLFKDQITVIEEDDYYFDRKHLLASLKKTNNYDHPDAINFTLFIEHLTALKKGNEIISQQYDFISKRSSQGPIVTPQKLILADGILLLAIPKLRELFDIKVFIEAADDVRLARRLERDHIRFTRNKTKLKTSEIQDTLKTWFETVQPMHNLFVRPSRHYADLLISNNHSHEKAVQVLASFLKGEIEK
jgi:uridine kinase